MKKLLTFVLVILFAVALYSFSGQELPAPVEKCLTVSMQLQDNISQTDCDNEIGLSEMLDDSFKTP